MRTKLILTLVLQNTLAPSPMIAHIVCRGAQHRAHLVTSATRVMLALTQAAITSAVAVGASALPVALGMAVQGISDSNNSDRAVVEGTEGRDPRKQEALEAAVGVEAVPSAVVAVFHFSLRPPRIHLVGATALVEVLAATPAAAVPHSVRNRLGSRPRSRPGTLLVGSLAAAAAPPTTKVAQEPPRQANSFRRSVAVGLVGTLSQLGGLSAAPVVLCFNLLRIWARLLRLALEQQQRPSLCNGDNSSSSSSSSSRIGARARAKAT